MEKNKVQNRSTKNDPVIKELPLACAYEVAAIAFLEKQRWGDSPACPCCGSVNVYQMQDSKAGERQANYRWRCRDCKKQYTFRTGTVFEDSRIELRHWCFAFWRAATSKNGVSALELHRQTSVSYKSCLFMLHRIRFAMADGVEGPLSGDVEADETYVGGKPRYKSSKNPRGTAGKQAVMAMVERGGRVKTKPVPNVTAKMLKAAILESVGADAQIITDEHASYQGIGEHYAGGHHVVCHSAKEYLRSDIHSNTVESFFSTVKRGLNGIYHSVSRTHLHRYMAEFEFRYNNRDLEDGERTSLAIKAAEGERLTYKEPGGKAD